MSTASAIPETYELEDDDARETLKRAGRKRLIKDSFVRFRSADGFSHARSLGHASALTAIPALITVIGFATTFDLTTFRNVLEHTLTTLAPGPAGRLLTSAFKQGSQSAGGTALVGGLIGALASGMFAMTQFERACNRIYGMARDRRIWPKLGVGLIMAASAGLLLAAAFLLLAAGGALNTGLARGTDAGDVVSTAFSIVRWPLGILLVFLALTLAYRVSPNRKQPGAKWLQTGTVMATALFLAFTGLLALYYSFNDQLGSTYGPLLGVVALLTWTYATALALLLGIAFSAELEATRAGVPGPRTLRRFNEMVRDPEETATLDIERLAFTPEVRGMARIREGAADKINS